MMIYSNFKGATGKHGPRISGWSRQVLKERLARQRRQKHKQTTRARHTKVANGWRAVRNRFSSHSWR